MDNTCGHSHDLDLSRWCGENRELHIPDVYIQREPMARLAAMIRRDREMHFCLLPFCHTLEAEALGAEICLGNDTTGPRASRPAWEKLDDVLNMELNLAAPRIVETLEAARLLSAEGEKVAFQLSGPLTILNSLLPSERIYRGMRREPALFLEVCRKLGQDLSALASAAEQAGVRIFSYADPMAASDIIGPRGCKMVTEGFLIPLLKELDRKLRPEARVCLCPKTAGALLGAGLASRCVHPLPEPMPYPEALVAMQGKLRFAGQSCIHNTKPTACIHEIVIGEV